MANDLNAFTIQSLLAPQTQALQALAMRPQKTYAKTTSTPYALEDLLSARAKIGESRRALDEALRGREGFDYRFASALAEMPQQQGYGSWLGDFASALGSAMAGGTNARIDRAQKAYETEAKDLASILALDKAMGDIQEQEIGYTPMEYGATGGAKSREQQATGGSMNGVQATNFGRSVGYDPVENIPSYGAVTRAALSEEQVNPLLKYVGGQTLAKGISGKRATQLQSTWSDISDNILSGRVLDFVGKAGGIRVADTPAEQEFIFGPIRNYQSMSEDQLRAGLKQARNNFVAAGKNKATQAGIDVSEKELKDWWNSAFSVPEGLETKSMYNIQNRPQDVTPTKTNTISAGEVRNGYRFKGGDPKKKENWEKAE